MCGATFFASLCMYLIVKRYEHYHGKTKSLQKFNLSYIDLVMITIRGQFGKKKKKKICKTKCFIINVELFKNVF